MSDERAVRVVRTGIANTASVEAALRRLGRSCVETHDPSEVGGAGLVVLPGVGSFGAGMATLRADGLVGPLRDRILAGRPTLCVCLGMQLLGASSDESPGETGLGVIDARAIAFDPADGVRVPQLGWNAVTPEGDGAAYLRPGGAYFANSYRFTEAPEGWRVALTDHAGPFVSAMERAGVLTCQFHPELSGPWGLALIERWLETAPERAAGGAAEGAGAC